MTRSGIPGEDQRFGAVLTRLDALLKRDHADELAPGAAGSDKALVVKDDAIPVLTDVYEGEVSGLAAVGRRDGLPPLIEDMVLSEKRNDGGDEVHQADAYFGSLALRQAEGVIGQHQADGSAAGYNAIVEKTLAALLPQFQEALTRAVKEETELALAQAQARVAERMQGETEAMLRSRLLEVLFESGFKPK